MISRWTCFFGLFTQILCSKLFLELKMIFNFRIILRMLSTTAKSVILKLLAFNLNAFFYFIVVARPPTVNHCFYCINQAFDDEQWPREIQKNRN